MQEFFLHYLWQMQYFDKAKLITTDGEPIEIFHPGTPNFHSGPDFGNARLRIHDIHWVGNVEIHSRSSHWYEHHHQHDESYDNVVLHVVWQDDKPVVRGDGTKIPTMELRGKVDQRLILKYRQLISSAFAIPCERSLRDVEPVVKTSMLSKVLMERLHRKADEVEEINSKNGGDWEETLYQLIFRNFGFKVNADPFFELSRHVPHKAIRKQGDKLLQIEALLFGQAGFLEERHGDAYYLQLRREHQLLTRKYNLGASKMSKAQWKFLRLRPANFPTLRLAQLSALLHHHNQLFSRIVESGGRSELHDLFAVAPSDYWHHHYSFSANASTAVHMLGVSSTENLLINTVVPLWVAYGRATDNQALIDRAVVLLENLPAEENSIITNWQNLGMDIRHSSDSQAAIELFNRYCHPHQCLRCAIGASLIRPNQN